VALALITEDTIRQLAGFRGHDAPVTSCYLDVDGRRFLRHQDYEHELEVLLRHARPKVNGHASVAKDFQRIEDFVRSGIDRARTRGLAMFACSAHDLWRVVPLPVPVRNQITINAAPAVRQLERVVHEFDRFGVLLADRQRARLFVFQLGELVDHSELFDELPRDYDHRGERERGDKRHHVEALASQHLRRAAAAAFEVFQRDGFEYLTIASPDEIRRELESDLHPYLRERLCRSLTVDVGAPLDEIRTAAMALESIVERSRQKAAVEQLRAAVGAHRRGASGLTQVLVALGQRRVHILLVSQGFSRKGWRCDRCATLADVGRRCQTCGGEMIEVDDVVEEAVEEAIQQGCRVEICVGNADLDVVGRIGALLRF
jgi:peptide subunit release factor 1 (eRF1)